MKIKLAIKHIVWINLIEMERGARTLFQIQRYLYSKNQQFATKCQQKKNVTLGTFTYSTAESPSKYCWKCGIVKNNLDMFCEKCHSIQAPPQKSNYFKILGIEESFNIDPKHLNSIFRKFQSLIHPDKFSNRTHEEQTISEEYSSLINMAYSSLMSPMKRAEHLLHLQGETIGEGQTIDEPDFLMQIMKLNEEVEDAEQDIEKLKQLNEKNKNELDKLAKEIDEHFKDQDIVSAKKSIIKLKYFTSISNRINSIFREAGVTD